MLQDDAGRRASMYAAVDLAAAAGAAVGPPGGWATSAELRSAQIRHAAEAENLEAEDLGLGPVTPAPPTASGSRAAEAEAAVSIAAAGVTEPVGAGDGMAGLLVPPPQLQQQQSQQAPAEEESTMELYSQLIRRRCCHSAVVPCTPNLGTKATLHTDTLWSASLGAIVCLMSIGIGCRLQAVTRAAGKNARGPDGPDELLLHAPHARRTNSHIP